MARRLCRGDTSALAAGPATMLIDLLPQLRELRLVLASASPRRIAILAQVGLTPAVIPSTFPEDLDKTAFTPREYVIENARRKACEVHSRVADSADIIIASDSVVECGGVILEKPHDEAEARAMMQMLSGARHHVHTGVCVLLRRAAVARTRTDEGARARAEVAAHMEGSVSARLDADHTMVTFAESTEVEFAPLPRATIDAYVRTSEPYDKAGGYGIQSTAAQFIAGIHGDYYNVMGFPLHRFCSVLRHILA